MERLWLIKARELKGLSVSELAARMGVVRSYISQIEKGTKTPSGKFALKLSRYLNVKMEKFFEDDVEFEENVELVK